MLGCPRTNTHHPVGGWCPKCPPVYETRVIKSYEKRRGYAYPHVPEVAHDTSCRIYLDIEACSPGADGKEYVTGSCEHTKLFVGAL